MPRFAPLTEFLAEPLTLPILGREYQIAPADVETGLRLTARFERLKAKADASGDPEEEVADDIEETELFRMALGPVYDQLKADGVPLRMAKFVASTAVIWHVYGPRAAELFWATGGDPKASPSTSKTSSTESGETPETRAAARSTRKPASASGTTPSRSRKTPARSGQTSSTAGT